MSQYSSLRYEVSNGRFPEHCVNKLITEQKRVTLSCIHTWQCSFSESFSLVIMCGYFLFHHGSLWAPKYHFPDSTKRVLANCFQSSKEQGCEMNSLIRKKFLRKLLSRFELKKFPLSAQASKRSEEALLRFLKDSVNGLLHET